ncbi:nitroreductase family protein [uncultured Sphaerochaeta sp.]|uniref:nitroreductase family protein n=1 Tax=uncultured Sphaerochaeta sp. TaxID=886478 RepID=UPI002A0A8E31|nr:nitroreductase family protein [uncultured Sphaerochaeta sp.]
MNEVMKSIITRRSIRSFQKKQVENEKLELVLHAATQAPNGMRQEPWHFTALQNPELLKKLDLLVAGEGKSFFYHAPTLILVSIEQGNRFAQADTACAMTNMMQAAHALGLGSVWCNRINGNNEIDTKLTEYGIPQGFQVTATLALGYAAEPLPEKLEHKVNTITYVR